MQINPLAHLAKVAFVMTCLWVFTSLPDAKAAPGQITPCASQLYGKGKLWEIRKGDGPKSFVFGTMHSRDRRILYLPGVVMQALNKSQFFMMETTLSEENMRTSRRLMMAPHGENMRQHLGERRLAQLKEIAPAYQIPLENLLQLKIWAIASVISQPPANSSQNSGQLTLLDRELEKIAKAEGKQIFALEKASDQLGLFDGLSKAAQLELLDSALEGFADLEDELETLTRHYIRGDINHFFCRMNKDLKDASPEIREFITDKLLIDRNHAMVSKIQSRIEQGAAFIAVGALHLPGEEGVLNLLKKQGYSLRKRF